eukprot:5151919-Ditylum_brightwellii.AAC.1
MRYVGWGSPSWASCNRRSDYAPLRAAQRRAAKRSPGVHDQGGLPTVRRAHRTTDPAHPRDAHAEPR